MPTKRKVFRLLLATLGVCLVAIVSFGLWLVIPGEPRSTSSLRFDGYILLPKGKFLNVLDYISFSGSDLFVTSESDGSVFKADLQQPSPAEVSVETVPGDGNSHGVVIDPLSKLAFVTRSGTNTVDVFRPDTLELVRHIPVADDADGIFYLPDDALIYVASGDAKVGTLIDPAKQATVGTVSLGGKPEFAIYDSAKRRLYQNLTDNNTIAAIDVRARSVTDRWPIDGCIGPSGMAMDFTSRRLFVVCGGNARLIVFDPDQHRVVSTLPIGSGPDSVAYDAILHRLYTAGLGGVLDVIQQDGPDAYRSLDAIRTHYGAHTLGLDPATHKVYVGYASLLVSPRLAVFTPDRKLPGT
jgi:DNA-binding beta-propeller fold protein YncE